MDGVNGNPREEPGRDTSVPLGFHQPRPSKTIPNIWRQRAASDAASSDGASVILPQWPCKSIRLSSVGQCQSYDSPECRVRCYETESGKTSVT